jgi:uncharacterized membrane protein
MDIERVIDIAAPQERVWAIMADVERWPEWTRSVKSVERLDRGRWASGAAHASASHVSRPRSGR